MSYNRKNLLQRVVDIQNTYKKHSKHFDGGCSDKYIYEQIVFPIYRISRSTFYEYLKTPAAKQLKQLEDEERKQLQLF